MKRTVLAFIFALTLSAQPRIVPTAPFAPTGTTTTLTLSMVGGGMNPAAFQFTLASLPTGAVITPGPGLVAAEQTLAFNVAQNGQVIIIVGSDTSSTATVPDGPVATITFPSAPYLFSATNVLAVDGQSNVVGFSVGTLSYGPSCDLNGDGKVDAADVALAKDQVLGKTACTSADLNNDGKCTQVDRQRVLIAKTGGACKIGL